MMTTNTCFLCFGDGKRTFEIINTYLQEFYEKITDLKISNSHPICYICHKRLQQSHQLAQTAQQTQELLKKFQENNSQITDKTKSLVDLSIKMAFNYSMSSEDMRVQEEITVKKEIEEEYNTEPDNDELTSVLSKEIPINIQSTEVKIEYEDSDTDEDIPLKYILDSKASTNFKPLVKVENDNSDLELEENKTKESFLTESQRASKSQKSGIVLVKSRPTDKLFVCNVCNYESSTKSYLLKHIKTHVNKNVTRDVYYYEYSNEKTLEKDTKEKLHLCNMCDYKTFRKSDLIRHERKHTGKKPFSCDLCEYKSSLKCNLIKHLRVHTGETLFSCDICDYKSSYKSHINRHKKKMHTESDNDIQSLLYQKIKLKKVQYRCDLCSYKSTTKSRFERHKRIHIDGKPFGCDVCNYTSIRKDDVTRHKKKHAKVEKEFICNRCNSIFYSKNDLIEHEVIHTGKKLLKCNLCSYVIADQRNFSRHKKIHTGEKPFRCGMCDYKSGRKDDLIRHFKIHAKEVG